MYSPKYRPIKIKQDTSNTDTLSHLTKKEFLIRTAISLILAVPFLVLAALCVRSPILLNIPLSLSNAKSVFTVISILWQFAATFPLGAIIMKCFSGEWYFQLQRTNILVPGRTDIVSTLTAGLVDYFRHAISSRSSNGFRFALILTLLSLAIRSVVPGAMSPGIIQMEERVPMKVTKALLSSADSTDSDAFTNWFYIWLDRSKMVGQLEQAGVVTFGLQPPTGWMVGWPNILPQNLTGTLRYPTDMIHFKHKCRWESQEYWDRNKHQGIWESTILGYDMHNLVTIPHNAHDTPQLLHSKLK